MHTTCPHCSAKITTGDNNPGTSANCPGCGKQFRLPDKPAPDPPPPSSPMKAVARSSFDWVESRSKVAEVNGGQNKQLRQVKAALADTARTKAEQPRIRDEEPLAPRRWPGIPSPGKGDLPTHVASLSTPVQSNRANVLPGPGSAADQEMEWLVGTADGDTSEALERLAEAELRADRLQQCPDCGHAVSRRAAQCPKCGCPLREIPTASPGHPATDTGPPTDRQGGEPALVCSFLSVCFAVLACGFFPPFAGVLALVFGILGIALAKGSEWKIGVIGVIMSMLCAVVGMYLGVVAVLTTH